MKKKITITIEAEFGTEFQGTILHNVLNAMLNALKIHMEDFNKQNKLTYVIDTNDGYSFKKY